MLHSTRLLRALLASSPGAEQASLAAWAADWMACLASGPPSAGAAAVKAELPAIMSALLQGSHQVGGQLAWAAGWMGEGTSGAGACLAGVGCHCACSHRLAGRVSFAGLLSDWRAYLHCLGLGALQQGDAAWLQHLAQAMGDAAQEESDAEEDGENANPNARAAGAASRSDAGAAHMKSAAAAASKLSDMPPVATHVIAAARSNKVGPMYGCAYCINGTSSGALQPA